MQALLATGRRTGLLVDLGESGFDVIAVEEGAVSHWSATSSRGGALVSLQVVLNK